MRRLKISICLYLVFVFLLAGLFAGVGTASAPDVSQSVPGEVIVGFEKITDDVCDAVEASGGEIVKEISVLKTLVVKVTVNEEEFIQSVRSIPSFRYAERNGLVQAAYTPSDPGWSYQWNMRIIEADKAWDIHKGSTNVVIAIVDTGIDYNHEDLTVHYVSGGYDWVNNDNDPWDDNYHGTHCAGIAAAVMDNVVGFVGVAQCSIWAEKVLNSTGYGGWDDLASAIIHATDNGVDVISMSLGGYGYSSLVDIACEYAWNNGVLLVAAAGNDNRNIDIDIYKYYPASFEKVIAVSATTSSDVRWSGSNYGSTVELAAPGYQVPSTIPGNSYGLATGTSMACPHVAGVAALTWSHNQSLTNIQLRNQLHAAVEDLGSPGKDVYYGYGRVNAFKALTVGITKVDTVLDFGFTPNPVGPGATVTLSGTLKTVGGSAVYPAPVTVEYSTDGGATWNYAWTLSTNAAGQFSKGFTAPGTPGNYQVRVRYAGSATYNPSSDTETLTVTAAANPTVETWTHKVTYARGELLNAYVQGFNPGPATNVKVNMWFGLPGGGTYGFETIYNGPVPASFTGPVSLWKSFTIPSYAAVGTYSVNAEIRNPATNALIDLDTYYFTVT